MPIEIKEYSEVNTSSQELEIMRKCVSTYDDRTLIFKETPIQSPFSIQVTFDEIRRCISGNDNIDGLIIDLTIAQRPGAKARKVINERFKQLDAKVKHVAFFTGKNIFLNTAVRFVIAGAKMSSYSVSSTFTDALQELNNAR